MGLRTRHFISSNFTRVFGLLPCPMEKSFPGLDESHFNEPQIQADPKLNSECSDDSATSPKQSANQKSHKVMSSNVESTQEALRNVLKQVENLESEENAEYLWAYFGKLLDRVFLYLHAVLSLAVVLFSLFC